MAVDATTMFIEDAMGHFTRPSGGGGGSTPVPITIAALNALATGAALVPGTTYQVTDWVSGTGSLPGPNFLYVEVDDPSTPSKFVRVSTPLGILGPSDGEMIWNFSGSLTLMARLRDNLGNDITDIGLGGIDAFPWGNIVWSGNTITGAALGAYADNAAAAAAGVGFADNNIKGGSIQLAGATGGAISGNFAPNGSLVVLSGAANVSVIGNTMLSTGNLTVDSGGVANANQVEAGAILEVQAGGTARECRVSAGASVLTGAFTQVGVIVDGQFVTTLTADNTGTLQNAGFSNVV